METIGWGSLGLTGGTVRPGEGTLGRASSETSQTWDSSYRREGASGSSLCYLEAGVSGR